MNNRELMCLSDEVKEEYSVPYEVIEDLIRKHFGLTKDYN